MMDAVNALGAAILAAPGSGDALATGLGLALAAAWVATVVLGARLRRVTVAHQDLQGRLQTLQEAHKVLQDKTEQTLRELGERRDALQELKQEITAQRKKTYATQEELRKVRDELREQTRLRIEAQTARSAFESVERPAPKAEPKPAAAPSPDKNPALEAAVATLQKDLEQLQAQHKALQDSMTAERTAAVEARQELKKQRKRAEDYRRIDIITKSKMEVLEDRLRHMGRAYYEAVSELAALKGLVVPPKPRDLPPERDPPADDEGIADEVETSPAVSRASVVSSSN